MRVSVRIGVGVVEVGLLTLAVLTIVLRGNREDGAPQDVRVILTAGTGETV